MADVPGVTLTHVRPDPAGDPVDALEMLPVERTGEEPFVAGPAIWAGPYVGHFGHMVAEGIHRLWAARVFPHLAEAMIVFQVDAHIDTRIPDWFIDVLGLCGVPPERAMFINRSTRFEALHVPAQGRMLGGRVLMADYLDLFPLAPVADRPD